VEWGALGGLNGAVLFDFTSNLAKIIGIRIYVMSKRYVLDIGIQYLLKIQRIFYETNNHRRYQILSGLNRWTKIYPFP